MYCSAVRTQSVASCTITLQQKCRCLMSGLQSCFALFLSCSVKVIGSVNAVYQSLKVRGHLHLQRQRNKLHQHLFNIRERKVSLKNTNTGIVSQYIKKTLSESTLKVKSVLIAALLCWNNLYTQKLFILTICKDKKPWACLLLVCTSSWWSIKCLFITLMAGTQGFVGECMHVHTLAGVTEVCCSEVKQKFKYLLSNKGITSSVECKASNRARRSESFWKESGNNIALIWGSSGVEAVFLAFV